MRTPSKLGILVLAQGPRLLVPAGAEAKPAEAKPGEACEVKGRVSGIAAPMAAVVFARSSEGTVVESVPTVVWRRVAQGFEPPLLVVCVGQEIRLVNDDSLCHRFFSAQAPQPFDGGLLQPGESGTFRLEEPGAVPVYCALHGGRQATILVVPTGRFAVVGPTGEFTLAGLQPGQCILEVWSEGCHAQQVDLIVPAGGLTGLELAVTAARPGR